MHELLALGDAVELAALEVVCELADHADNFVENHGDRHAEGRRRNALRVVGVSKVIPSRISRNARRDDFPIKTSASGQHAGIRQHRIVAALSGWLRRDRDRGRGFARQMRDEAVERLAVGEHGHASSANLRASPASRCAPAACRAFCQAGGAVSVARIASLALT